MSSQDQVGGSGHEAAITSSIPPSYFRLHQTTADLEIVFAPDPKHGLQDTILHSFDEVTEEIKRRTDKIAGNTKDVR